MKVKTKICKGFITKNTVLNAIQKYKKIAYIRMVDENEKYIYLEIISKKMDTELVKKEFNNYCIGTEGWDNES